MCTKKPTVKWALRQTDSPKDDYFDVKRRDRLGRCFAYGWSLAFSPTKKKEWEEYKNTHKFVGDEK